VLCSFWFYSHCFEAHCHEQSETKGFQMCKRHEREWDNKQRQGPRVKKDGTVVGASAVAAASVATAGAVSGGAVTGGAASAGLGAAAVLEKVTVPFKRARTDGVDNDAYGLAEREGRTQQSRKCPRCDRQVPDKSSFFSLHQASCNGGNAVGLSEAENAGKVERAALLAREETRGRRARVEALMEGVLAEKKDEEDEEEDEEGRVEQQRQHSQLLQEVTATAERMREVLERGGRRGDQEEQQEEQELPQERRGGGQTSAWGQRHEEGMVRAARTVEYKPPCEHPVFIQLK
jgi:hypothetical protein